jgi:hypothetical protein
MEQQVLGVQKAEDTTCRRVRNAGEDGSNHTMPHSSINHEPTLKPTL